MINKQMRWNKENVWNVTNPCAAGPTKNFAAMPAAMHTTTKSWAAPPIICEKLTAF